MAHPAKPLQDTTQEGSDASAEIRLHPLSAGGGRAPFAGLPLMLNVRDMIAPPQSPPAAPRFVDVSSTPVPAKPPRIRRGKSAAVLRGLKDLQDLQKQTNAVLEAVKSTLDDIQQVLRSPEATRGMEKQRNAALLLSKGFAHEAVEQAHDAVGLLPANPEAYLLLSLSLAANQEYDTALGAAQKGLALFDRRAHPLAIEAGLLHALASLGCVEEAVERWTAIIDTLPLPVMFEHLGRIASCFPRRTIADAQGSLDDLVNRRLARDEQHAALLDPEARRQRVGKVQIFPDEIPAPSLFAGLDAAKDFGLPNTHRAVLGQIARRLQCVRESPTRINGEDAVLAEVGAAGVIKFLTECLIPLGNRNLERTVDALGRTAVKRLLRFHADAPTLHRALGKLDLAGATHAAKDLAALLDHWRREGNKVALAKLSLKLSWALEATGVLLFAYVLWGLGAVNGASPSIPLFGMQVPLFWIGPVMLILGAAIGIVAMFNRTWQVERPYGRPPLSKSERNFLNTPDVKPSLTR